MIYQNKIIQGDCLEVLKTLDSESVDLVCTDPPYGTLDGRGKVNKKGSKLADFNVGEWDRALPLAWIPEALRVLRPGGWIVAFTDKLSVKAVWQAIEQGGG